MQAPRPKKPPKTAGTTNYRCLSSFAFYISLNIFISFINLPCIYFEQFQIKTSEFCTHWAEKLSHPQSLMDETCSVQVSLPHAERQSCRAAGLHCPLTWPLEWVCSGRTGRASSLGLAVHSFNKHIRYVLAKVDLTVRRYGLVFHQLKVLRS